MTINFYHLKGSPPCGIVQLTAKLLKINLNFKHIDFEKQEQLSPEFTKINPQRIVPTIDDDGFILWESRAIITYLVQRYGADDDSLYPKDVNKRAVINQRLYFDMGLYDRLAQHFYPVIFGDQKDFDSGTLSKLEDGFKILDQFIQDQTYFAGNSLTLADISIVGTVSASEAMKFDLSPYKNVNKWYENMKKLPGYDEANGENANALKEYAEQLLQKKK